VGLLSKSFVHSVGHVRLADDSFAIRKVNPAPSQMIYTPLLITKNLVVGACKVLSSLLVPLAALSGMGPDTASFIAQRRPDLCSLFNTLFVTFLLPVAFNPV
jgi:hypothetical protein